MDELLSKYSQEKLLSELGKGHYWFYNGRFYANNQKLKDKHPASVENAVYFRYYT